MPLQSNAESVHDHFFLDYLQSVKGVNAWYYNQRFLGRGGNGTAFLVTCSSGPNVGNGPEFTSRRILGWATDRKVELVHIQPGRPMQNGHVESFHGRLRDECLNTAWFRTLGDVRQKLADWQQEYNCERPHSSLDYRTPNEFKRACDESWATAQLSSQNINHQHERETPLMNG